MNAAIEWPRNDAETIARALAVEGGHLSIGHGGGTLYYARGSRLSGFAIEPMKAACIAAGVPVFDTRHLDFGTVWDLAWRSPMVAVDEPACPEPWHGMSIAPLAHVAALYRAAGAEIVNLPCH